jgi:hypothetical protein
MDDTIDELRKTMMVRLNKIIKVATEAKEVFDDIEDDDKAYIELNADLCNLSAHIDFMFSAIASRAHAKKHKEEKKAKKKDKKKKHK